MNKYADLYELLKYRRAQIDNAMQQLAEVKEHRNSESKDSSWMWNELEELGLYPWPFLPPVVDELQSIRQELNRMRTERTDKNIVQCPFLSTDGTSNAIHMMIGHGQQDGAYRELRDFTKNTEKLIIVDPYFFSIKKTDLEFHLSIVEKNLRLKSLKKIHVIYSARKGNSTSTAVSQFKKLATNCGCGYSEYQTDEIHDRVYISDRSKAIVVGTSFNGLGNRAAFILDLPQNDLNAILNFLDENGFSRAT